MYTLAATTTAFDPPTMAGTLLGSISENLTAALGKFNKQAKARLTMDEVGHCDGM